MSPKPEEDDLDDLLAALPDNPDLSKEDIAEIEKKSIQPVQEPVIIPNVQLIPPSDLLTINEKANDLIAPFIELLRIFPNTAKKIIDNHAKDRDQVENAIILMEGQMETIRSQNGKIPAAMLEAWVKLLAIKAEINANANGVLDSSAKMLAAAKNNNIVINVGELDKQSMSGLDLNALLSQPPRSDEALTRKLKNGP
jgi:hypothetical protein